MRRPWAIVCDFDGTALTADLGDQVALRFAGAEIYDEAERLYRRGEVTFAELLARIFAPITASRDDIAAFARERGAFRPGFDRFVGACREAGVPFLVVSHGLDAYIEPVLATLPSHLREHLALRANRAACSGEGLTVGFGGRDCGFCGFCKGHVVDELRAAGHRVAVCGDGSGDRHAAERADAVFARAGSTLARWCGETGLAHTTFSTFDEVMAAFPAA